MLLVVSSSFYCFVTVSNCTYRELVKLSGPPPTPTQHADHDVIVEATHISQAHPEDYTLLLRDIVKTYPSPIVFGKAKHAVRGMSLGCAGGERFGLLGINGAGKVLDT
jgi:ABC-type glutathione transport system ATPase component